MVSADGVQCGCCEEGGVKEIWYRSDNDATCTDCFEKAEHDRRLHAEIQAHYKKLAREEETAKLREGTQPAPKSYMHECPFCCEVTKWVLMPKVKLEDLSKTAKVTKMHFARCLSCNNEGTTQVYPCSRCNIRDRHVYRDLVKAMEPGVKVEDCLTCADCYLGMGNKDVIDISVLHCLFCKWRIQTFYEYGIGKMRCTNCRYLRTSLGTAGVNND